MKGIQLKIRNRQECQHLEKNCYKTHLIKIVIILLQFALSPFLQHSLKSTPKISSTPVLAIIQIKKHAII